MASECRFPYVISIETENLQGDRHQKSEFSETETIRLAQRGDAGAFERIHRAHSARVYALCLRMVRNAAEAEDLTQEAFLLVFRKLNTFRGASAFSTWLHRLVVNVVLMNLRRKRLPLEERTDPTHGGLENEVGSAAISPTGLVEHLNLKRAVVRLTPVCRRVFVLHDIQGFKHREIAGMMDCSGGTSKAQLHRARKRLRKLLQGSQNRCAAVPGNASYGGEREFSF